MLKGIPKIAWISAIIGIFILLFYIISNYVKAVNTIWNTFFGWIKGTNKPVTKKEAGQFNKFNFTPHLNHKEIADIQLFYMDRLGTNEEELFRPFNENNLNADDLNYIYYLFGIKKNKNIIDWYRSELSGNDLITMRAYWYNSHHRI